MKAHKYLNFLQKQWSKLLLIFLAIATIAVWGERYLNSSRLHSQQDFLIGNQIVERFLKGEPLASESLEATEMLLEHHPELHPKFDALLAMSYLSQRDPSRALPYAETMLAHVIEDLSSFYQSYASTSLLIAQKRYQEAYTETQALYIHLKEKEAGSTLHAMNLLRLISLEKQLGIQSNLFQELKAHPSFASLSAIFHEGSVSLEEWYSYML